MKTSNKKTKKILKNTLVFGTIGTVVIYLIYYLLYGFPIYAGMTYILINAGAMALFMYSICFYLYYLLEYYKK